MVLGGHGVVPEHRGNHVRITRALMLLMSIGIPLENTKRPQPRRTPAQSSALLSVAEGLRMLTSLCTGRYPRIVRREGRICRRFRCLVVRTCGMAHCLRVVRSAVVTRHYGVVDGKRRRTHCPYQQRRGSKHGHYSLYSTQRTLLTLSSLPE